MNHKIKITLPKPCHQKWEEMTVIDKERFCNSCQNIVIDFTKATDREIFQFLNKNEIHCGRFLNHQLNRELKIQKERKSYRILWFTLFFSILGINKSISQNSPKIEQTDKKLLKETDSLKFNDDELIIEGIVNDKTGALPGAYVTIQGTNISIQTDFDGKFSINAKAKDIIIFSFAGYKKYKFKVKKNSGKLSINLKEIRNNGEIYTMGGYYKVEPKKRTFLGRIFNNSKYKN
jgi:hypothetical protein